MCGRQRRTERRPVALINHIAYRIYGEFNTIQHATRNSRNGSAVRQVRDVQYVGRGRAASLLFI